MRENRADRAADLYELLEVSPGASPEVIQAAYHVLARTWHPDINNSPAASRRMGELNCAYAVLSDANRRAIYDLERMRLRRRERLLNSGEAISRSPVRQMTAESGRERALAARRAYAAIGPNALGVRNGRLMLAVLGALTALITVILFVILVGMAIAEDTPSDSSNSITLMDMHVRAPAPDFDN